MKLAKQFLDVGLFTIRPQELMTFWRDEVGAAFDHILPIGDGHDQYRMNLFGSVLKINALEQMGDFAPSGYHEVLVARDDIVEPLLLIDPDGNHVRLVPRGYRHVQQIGIQIGVRSVEAHRQFMRDALQLEPVDETAFGVGDSRILIVQDEHVGGDAQLIGSGWRYITIQIFDALYEHERFLLSGGFPGTPIQRLEDIAMFAMVRDPDGNWIELSQRVSLTGVLV